MIDDDDIVAAVAAGVLTADTATSLRAFSETRRNVSVPDDEQFRLLTGFNDIFVGIAIVMLLIALGWLGSNVAAALGPALVAITSWALAEFFTRKRHMALPSILLLLGFVGGVFATGFVGALFATSLVPVEKYGVVGQLIIPPVALMAILAAFAHWRRFKVPVTVAAGACVAAGGIIATASKLVEKQAILQFTLAAGICMFALALWWDMSDPARRTRRADVAFWLHLAAAPLIVHPAFSLLGLNAGWTDDAKLAATGLDVFIQPALALAIYLVLALVALIIDRRALMVSALAYLLFAMTAVFRATGALSTSFALSALVAGAGLLLLSAYWRATRRAALVLVPRALRRSLPAP